jgi:hypothetical protein
MDLTFSISEDSGRLGAGHNLQEESLVRAAALTDRRIKYLLKAAVEEVLEERRDIVRDAVVDALEDLGMTRAIQDGLRTPIVSQRRVLRLLSGQ